MDMKLVSSNTERSNFRDTGMTRDVSFDIDSSCADAWKYMFERKFLEKGFTTSTVPGDPAKGEYEMSYTSNGISVTIGNVDHYQSKFGVVEVTV